VVARLLLASTSEVYGDPKVHPWPEAYRGSVNTIGPRMPPDDGRVVSNFIVQALRGEPLTLYGDGSQTRSFCYVEGLIRLMNGRYPGPMNLGNPGEFTIRQLAELVRERINPALPLVLQPLSQDDPLQRQPEIALARRELGWDPIVPLEQGLDATIAWFRTGGPGP
jgi:UDP-glucuronate decarboxylase